MADTVDPVTVSVVQHRLHAIVEEMGEAMLRTSYSQILNSSRDFSTAICDLNGRLIAQAEHVPIHVGALPWAARAVDRILRRRHPPRRRLPAQRPLSRRQSHPGPHRLRAGVRRRQTAVLVDQPRAPERHRRRDARRLQCRPRPRSGRRASGSRHCASTIAARCGATCWRCWRPTFATRTTSVAIWRR